MNRKTNIPRTIMSLALIASGIYFLLSPHIHIDSDSFVVAAEVMPDSNVQSTDLSGITPIFQNAKVETRALAGELSAELNRWAQSVTDAQWLGYAVPAIDGERTICCGGNGDWNGYRDCGPCYLEDSRHDASFTSGPSEVKLEGPRALIVLFRASAGQIGKIRVVSELCKLDAGGLRVTWLTGVNAAKSVEHLTGFVRGQDFSDHGPERLQQGALTAIAMHRDTSADKALNSFVAADQPESLRKQTVFWLGEARGASGFQTLKQLAKTDTSSEVRSQVTFALSLNKDPGAVDEMIRMAKEDASTHVRGQALFWLAQKAGRKASATITDAIDNDPNTEVKKKAVFALSQMPKDEGVPKLIQVAETNKNREVRKQAMFWLGQSNDPRALEFFEKILSK
ncbi:MAG: HEAT repeat domain-containing protein [Acidobacteria bacterium]|nr:HEAT repeat domain-containing protein [Acidobacteriota bacterium]